MIGPLTWWRPGKLGASVNMNKLKPGILRDKDWIKIEQINLLWTPPSFPVSKYRKLYSSWESLHLLVLS